MKIEDVCMCLAAKKKFEPCLRDTDLTLFCRPWLGISSLPNWVISPSVSQNMGDMLFHNPLYGGNRHTGIVLVLVGT